VSIIIVSYNGLTDINACLESIEGQSYKKYEVIVVDCASTDGTPEYIASHFPHVKLVRSKLNLGYSGGNALGLNYAQGEFVAILNQDVSLDKDWLHELLRGAERHPESGIIASNVLFHDNPRIVNAYGNDVHFTGLVFSRFLGESEEHCKEEYLIAPCGAAFIVRREVIDDVGFIDSAFFMEFGDIDFALRVWLRGWKCVIIPTAKAFHKFVLKMTPRRYFILERGRYLLLLKNFSGRTLALMFPSLMLTEMLTWAYALYCGKDYAISKIAAYKWILKNLAKTMKKREKVQKLRRIQDKNLLKLTTCKISIPGKWLGGSAKSFIETTFNKLYQVFYRISYLFV
jgi:hypothetical protein